jgi:hypothetical protein
MERVLGFLGGSFLFIALCRSGFLGENLYSVKKDAYTLRSMLLYDKLTYGDGKVVVYCLRPITLRFQ